MGAPVVHVIDAESGNLCSLENALRKLGYSVKWVKSADYDWNSIERLIFPGVGNFGHFMNGVFSAGLAKPVGEYIASGKPFMGICVGLQALFSGSTESPGVKGLNLIHDTLREFDKSTKSVPQIGWNSAVYDKDPSLSIYGLRPCSKYYYVHSYRASTKVAREAGWTIVKANYMGEEFIGALAKDNIFATQFHPEKSGVAGLRVIKAFLEGINVEKLSSKYSGLDDSWNKGQLTKRVIACLDVRSNDEGDLVVTKGDQYDVREKSDSGKSNVRNLGKPVDLARRYYEEGADEITFLNITSFRDCPLKDAPMLEVLRRTAETVFVPLTIGGGIRDTVDPDGTLIPALDVAVLYFRSGADKVSIGSDAVLAAEQYYANDCKLSGKSPMETISNAYGAQAVVVSVDPKRVYVSVQEDTPHHTIKTAFPDEHGRSYVWYQCTIKGGRETRDLDVFQLVKAVEAMGAGEILLNCIDKDGTNSGFDLELIQDVKDAVSIPVIASSGAGNPQHFLDVFEKTTTDAALGAGMFHRGEYTVNDIKKYLSDNGLLVRNDPDIDL